MPSQLVQFTSQIMTGAMNQVTPLIAAIHLLEPVNHRYLNVLQVTF